jgi:hypothetical protein
MTALRLVVGCGDAGDTCKEAINPTNRDTVW